MNKYICSKLSSDQAYTTWYKDTANNMPRKNKQVLIKGGAGVANKKVITPYGVITQVTEEQIKQLQDNCPSFNRHLKAGYLKILEKDPRDKEIEKIADDMQKDGSAPITPKDLKKEGKDEGKINKKAK